MDAKGDKTNAGHSPSKGLGGDRTELPEAYNMPTAAAFTFMMAGDFRLGLARPSRERTMGLTSGTSQQRARYANSDSRIWMCFKNVHPLQKYRRVTNAIITSKHKSAYNNIIRLKLF